MPDQVPGKKKKATAQRFVTCGSFVVMPLSFPDVTVPVDPDESFVTALDVGPDGRVVVGGTSGVRAHVFAAFPKPPAGLVMDLGAIDGATETRAALARGRRVFAAVNGPAGGSLVTQWIPWHVDGIQEWSTWRPPLGVLARFEGERILDLAIAPDGSFACCLTPRRVVRVSLDGVPTELTHENLAREIPEGAREDVADARVREPAVPRFARANDGALFATLDGAMLARIDVASARAESTGVALPFGAGWGWASTPGGEVIAADGEGRFTAFDPKEARAAPAGEAPLGPVKCMTSTGDGRCFGLCGEGIGRMFTYDPGRGEAADLGAVAGVHGAKRYAYTFAAAAAGPDGEVYFAEDDRGGHLWIYCPPATRARTGGST